MSEATNNPGWNFIAVGLLGLAVVALIATFHFIFGTPLHARYHDGPLSDGEVVSGLLIVSGFCGIFIALGGVLSVLKTQKRG